MIFEYMIEDKELEAVRSLQEYNEYLESKL